MIYKNFYLENDNNIFILLLQKFLNCGTDDLKKLQEWDEILDNHNLDFSDVLDCLNEIYLNKDFELNYNILIMGIFEILLNEFQEDFNLKLEQGKDYNLDLNYYISDIYFTDKKLQEKFDKWL